MNLQTCMFVFIKIICDHKMGNTFSFVCCMVPGVQDNYKDDSSSCIEEAILGHDLQEEAVMKSFGGRIKCGGLCTPHQVHLGNMVVVFSKFDRQ